MTTSDHDESLLHSPPAEQLVDGIGCGHGFSQHHHSGLPRRQSVGGVQVTGPRIVRQFYPYMNVLPTNGDGVDPVIRIDDLTQDHFANVGAQCLIDHHGIAAAPVVVFVKPLVFAGRRRALVVT